MKRWLLLSLAIVLTSTVAFTEPAKEDYRAIDFVTLGDGYTVVEVNGVSALRMSWGCNCGIVINEAMKIIFLLNIPEEKDI